MEDDCQETIDFIAELDETACEQEDILDQTLEEANEEGQVQIEDLELVDN